jgi:regulator of sirC expression with transglutaminase-like and TPR domain
MGSEQAVQRLALLRQLPDEAISLAEAMHLMQVRVGASTGRSPCEALDALAVGCKARVSAAQGPQARLVALCRYLGEECGFTGDEEDYHDPANSDLATVLERRRGIPLTLSVVYIEVAVRVGVSLSATGFPYHLLLTAAPLEDTYVDPFRAGRVMTGRECEALLEKMSKGSLAFKPRYLEPVGARGVLTRSLRNLKFAHLLRGEVVEAVEYVTMMLEWNPRLSAERRDRGLLCAQLKRWGMAARDMERYLAERPVAEDRMKIEVELMKVRRELLKIN